MKRKSDDLDEAIDKPQRDINNERRFNDLPIEILPQVLSYLEFEDLRKECCRVSKAWRNAITQIEVIDILFVKTEKMIWLDQLEFARKYFTKVREIKISWGHGSSIDDEGVYIAIRSLLSNSSILKHFQYRTCCNMRSRNRTNTLMNHALPMEPLVHADMLESLTICYDKVHETDLNNLICILRDKFHLKVLRLRMPTMHKADEQRKLQGMLGFIGDLHNLCELHLTNRGKTGFKVIGPLYLELILPKLNQLEVLKLSHVVGKDLELISKHCPKLRSFSMEGKTMIVFTDLINLLRSCPICVLSVAGMGWPRPIRIQAVDLIEMCTANKTLARLMLDCAYIPDANKKNDDDLHSEASNIKSLATHVSNGRVNVEWLGLNK